MDLLRDPFVTCCLAALPGSLALGWRVRRYGPAHTIPVVVLILLAQAGGFLMLGHLYYVTAVPLQAAPGEWVYDMRFYGMVLYGLIVLGACGIAVVDAVGLANRRAGAARRAGLAVSVVLVATLPLIPLQSLATAMCIGAGVALVAVLLAGRAGQAESS